MKLLEVFRARAVLLLAAGLALSSIGAQGQSISNKSLEEYRVWAKSVYPERDVALAVAPNGSWAAESGFTKSQAKQKALNNCKYSHYNPDNDPCRIVDVNLLRVDTSVATTSANSSDNGWCVTDTGISQTSKSYCVSRHGHWSWTYNGALKARQRLKSQSSTVATTSSNERVWCAYPRLFYGKGFERVHPDVCTQRSGTVTESANLAAYEHRRLKNQSSTVATTSANSSDTGWCATGASVFKEYAADCDIKGGNWSSTYEAAKAEHLHLKNQSSTVVTTTEAVDPQPAEINQSALELEFWKTIKDSDAPDMFREYLRQFPSGTYAGLAKIKIKKLGGAATSIATASIPNLDYGDYHALVVGNNRYQNLRDLRSAVNDAKAISTILEIDYGFDVELLENATRKDILRSLKRLRETVREKDNVLIYYAGHGSLDHAADEGYWLPVDAERDDDSNWILTDRVTSQVKAMKAKHVMVVADSCFSGTITRAIKIEQRTPEWLSEIVKKKARTALTSGGLEPVLDTGSGNHSAFAYAFISLLEENDGVLDASQLFSKLRPKVMVNSTQTPQYGKIHMAGDDGGDFLFVRR